MEKACVLIITGEEMKDISNQIFQLEVVKRCTHTHILEQFMLDKGVLYPYLDFRSSNAIVKMAIMDNIVVYVGKKDHILALPDVISTYQKEELEKIEQFFNNDISRFSTMNIQKEAGKIIYEGLNEKDSKRTYSELVDKKHEKWRKGQKVKSLNYSES